METLQALPAIPAPKKPEALKQSLTGQIVNLWDNSVVFRCYGATRATVRYSVSRAWRKFMGKDPDFEFHHYFQIADEYGNYGITPL